MGVCDQVVLIGEVSFLHVDIRRLAQFMGFFEPVLHGHAVLDDTGVFEPFAKSLHRDGCV